MARRPTFAASLTLLSALLADALPRPRHIVRRPIRLSASSSSPDPAVVARRLVSPEAAKLGQELVDLGLRQDPQVVLRRSLDLAQALNTVSTEVRMRGRGAAMRAKRPARGLIAVWPASTLPPMTYGCPLRPCRIIIAHIAELPRRPRLHACLATTATIAHAG
jgi:hypothetical protein